MATWVRTPYRNVTTTGRLILPGGPVLDIANRSCQSLPRARAAPALRTAMGTNGTLRVAKPDNDLT